MIIVILIIYMSIGVAIFVMAVGYDQFRHKKSREMLPVAFGSLMWLPLLIREIWRGYQRGR